MSDKCVKHSNWSCDTGWDDVWLVGEGEYSDWHVKALFSNEEAALRYVRQKNQHWSSEVNGPERQRVYDECPAIQNLLTKQTRVHADGRVEELNETTSLEVPDIDHKPLTVFQSIQRAYIVITVYGFDFDRVRKVSSERVASVKANYELLQAAATVPELREIDE